MRFCIPINCPLSGLRAHRPYAQAPVFLKYVYRLRLYVRFISPILKRARAIPMLLIVISFIVFVIIPNTCSTLARICDFALFSLFCPFVNGLFLFPFSCIRFFTPAGIHPCTSSPT
jgi:hypothetical protein